MTTIATRRRQRGLSMIGFLFVAAVVLVVALLAFRMIPAYIEYYTIQKALEGALADSNDLSTAHDPPRHGSQALRRLRRCGHAEGRRGDQERQHDHRVGRAGRRCSRWSSNVSLLLEFDASASR